MHKNKISPRLRLHIRVGGIAVQNNAKAAWEIIETQTASSKMLTGARVTHCKAMVEELSFH